MNFSNQQSLNYQNPVFGLLFLLILFSFTKTSVYAQSDGHEYSGSIKNEMGISLKDVLIQTEDGTVLDTTDLQGIYTFESSNKIIVCSLEGYQDLKTELSTVGYTNITLKTQVHAGALNPEQHPGALSYIDYSGIREVPATDINNALEGRIVGLTPPDFTIRGGKPLYVIDDVPFYGDIYSLNPELIQSVTVLRDGMASAHYGPDAYNGVVKIKTNRGAFSKPTILYNGYVGVSKLYKEITFTDQQKEDFEPDEIEYYESRVKEANKAGSIENHTLALTGGTANTTYYISGNYLGQRYLYTGTKRKQYALSGFVDQKIGNILNIGLSTLYISGNAKPAEIPKTPESLLDFSDIDPFRRTPLLFNTDNSTNSKQFRNNLNIGVNILKTLFFQTGLGRASYEFQKDIPSFSLIYLPNQIEETPLLEKEFYKNELISFINKIHYVRNFSDKHVLQVSGEANFYTKKVMEQNILTVDNIVTQISKEDDTYNQIFYAGTLNYSFDSRYFIDLILGNYSEKQLSEKRITDHILLGLSWNIRNEPFLMNQHTISTLRIRSNFLFRSDELSLNNNKIRQRNIGIDLGIFMDRLSGSVEIYNNHADNEITSQAISYPGINITLYPDNLWLLNSKRKGVELSLEAKIIAPKTKNGISWEMGCLFSGYDASSKIDVRSIDIDSTDLNFNPPATESGYPIQNYYGYYVNSIFQGQIDTLSDPAERIYLKTEPLPEKIFRLNTSFSISGFDLFIAGYGIIEKSKTGSIENGDVVYKNEKYIRVNLRDIRLSYTFGKAPFGSPASLFKAYLHIQNPFDCMNSGKNYYVASGRTFYTGINLMF